ncbi:MAG: carotenoid oxygenase family protein, partial [Chloroflexota bacterium]
MTNRFRKGFETIHNEITIDNVPVEGEIPSWLTGTLLRTGPAQFEVGTRSYNHWFDGLAMLRRFTFDGNQVSFSNKFVQSEPYRVDNKTGKINFRGFSVDPCVTLFRAAMALFAPLPGMVNPVVSIQKIEDRYIAMTEMPLAVEIDPETLAIRGDFPTKNVPDAQTSTAHPLFDASAGETYNVMVKFGVNHEYRVYKQFTDHYDVIGTVSADEPAYMHSFAMSEKYIVLLEYPFRLPQLPQRNLLSMATVQRPFIEAFEWMEDTPTRLRVISKATGEVVNTVMTDPFFAFHVINAYEADDAIVVDVSAYPDASVIDDLYLHNLRGSDFVSRGGDMTRLHVPLNGDTATQTVVGTEQIELPRINEAYNGREYRFAYGAGFQRGTNDFIDQVVKIDAVTNETRVWHEDGCYPSEPIFVSAPDATAEDDGVVLSVVLDTNNERSFMLVLDGQSFEEVARANVPIALPFDFHGAFLNP